VISPAGEPLIDFLLQISLAGVSEKWNWQTNGSVFASDASNTRSCNPSGDDPKTSFPVETILTNLMEAITVLKG
jgi:hypothetical protein